jgi:hypothetical protein
MKLVHIPYLLILYPAILCAQGRVEGQQIPARVLRTAEIIGTRTDIEDLAKLRQSAARDELKEISLVQHLQGMIIATSLDVDGVNARIDYETARLQEVQSDLAGKRDRRLSLLNVANLVLGSGVGAVGSGLQLIGSAQHAGDIVSTSAGFGGTMLSLLGVRQSRGIVRAPGYTPSMLAKLLGKTPTQDSEFPPEIWKYLTTPDSNLPRTSTGQQHLLFEWTTFGHLKEHPAPRTIEALTSTGKDGTPLNIDIIADRTAMLAETRAHVGAMKVDLAELMRFVVDGSFFQRQ